MSYIHTHHFHPFITPTQFYFLTKIKKIVKIVHKLKNKIYSKKKKSKLHLFFNLNQGKITTPCLDTLNSLCSENEQ